MSPAVMTPNKEMDEESESDSDCQVSEGENDQAFTIGEYTIKNLSKHTSALPKKENTIEDTIYMPVFLPGSSIIMKKPGMSNKPSILT
jgi:hypothetical protein